MLAMLKTDESMLMDGSVEGQEEGRENEVSPSEILATRFELEPAGRSKQLPGQNFVKTFSASFRSAFQLAVEGEHPHEKPFGIQVSTPGRQGGK